MPERVSSFLPLSPAALHIMAALAGEQKHGYGIMQEVKKRSRGQYRIGSGTFYDNLERLISQGLVGEGSKPGAGDDPRRRYYLLTEQGLAVLEAEITRLETLARHVRRMLKPSGSNNW